MIEMLSRTRQHILRNINPDSYLSIQMQTYRISQNLRSGLRVLQNQPRIRSDLVIDCFA